jgi:hypothetical protein
MGYRCRGRMEGTAELNCFETPPRAITSLPLSQDCQFVGLDLVPLFPDLNLVGKGELNVRIQWTTSNFLEPLPFSDQEFDYIHAKGIAVAVPEDKVTPTSCPFFRITTYKSFEYHPRSGTS